MKKSKMRENFIKLLEKRGFNSIRQFAISCEMESSNIYSNITGKTNVGINRLFTYANALGVPVMDVIQVFYEDEIKENEKAIQLRDIYLNQLNE